MTMQWFKKASKDCIGINTVQYAIQTYEQEFNTQIVVSKLNPQKTYPNENFRVEVWTHLESGCTIIVAYSLDYV